MLFPGWRIRRTILTVLPEAKLSKPFSDGNGGRIIRVEFIDDDGDRETLGRALKSLGGRRVLINIRYARDANGRLLPGGWDVHFHRVGSQSFWRMTLIHWNIF